LTIPDALKLLTTRRSVKPTDLLPPGPTAEQLETLLTVASRVPDHGKLTPWRFIVFEGRGREAAGNAIAAVFAADNPGADEARLTIERTRLTRAPLVVAVVSRSREHAKIPQWEQVLSAGAVAMNLLTAANAMGFGANWITEWYAYDGRVLAQLGVTPDERVAGFVHIGTPKLVPQDRDRPALNDIVTRFAG
jgi:nitroreductase